MLAFRVDDMTCGHCVSTISKAVHAVDAGGSPGLTLPLWEPLQYKLAKRETCSSMEGGLARCTDPP